MIFTSLEPGTSVEGQKIPAFRSETSGDKYIYLIGGTHGDEVEGIYVLKKLFDWLKDNHEIHDLPMIVVPTLNIDGFRNQTRVNSNGVDLNRNYPTKNWCKEFKKEKYNPGSKGLSEPENKFLEVLFKKYPPIMALSFHTWKPILNYNGQEMEPIARFLATFNNYPVQDDIGYPTPGSLGTYLPEKYGASVLTFECPELTEEKGLEEIWKENEVGLKKLFERNLLEFSL